MSKLFPAQRSFYIGYMTAIASFLMMVPTYSVKSPVTGIFIGTVISSVMYGIGQYAAQKTGDK